MCLCSGIKLSTTYVVVQRLLMPYAAAPRYAASWTRRYHTVPSPKSSRSIPQYIRISPWGPRPGEMSAVEVDNSDEVYGIKLPRAKKGSMDPDGFRHVGEVLRKYNMNAKEIQGNPVLFSMPAREIELRLESFKECGWETFSADMIVFANSLFTKRTARDLIGSESESVTRSVLRCLLDELQVDESRQQQLLSSISASATASLTLHDCRCLALRQYLRSLYTEDEISRTLAIAMKAVGAIRTVKGIKQVLRYLQEDFKLPIERIFKYEVLLTRDEIHLEEHLRNPKFMEFDLRVIASNYPRVICVPAQHLRQFESVLTEHGFTPFQLTRAYFLTSLNPATVAKRLTALKADPDLWKFKEHPSFLELVVRYVDVMRRLSFLRIMKVKDFGLDLLICHRKKFHITTSHNITHASTPRVNPNYLFHVAEYLGTSLCEVRKRMRAQIKSIPLYAGNERDVLGVLQCLTDCEITKQQILEALSIVLYPAEVVKRHLEAVLNEPGMNERRQQKNFLHYAIFTMEKESNFGGPAAWSPVGGASVSEEGDEWEISPAASVAVITPAVRSAMSERLSQHFPASEDDEKDAVIVENNKDVGKEQDTDKEWFHD
ncbi:uncharacterized protein LOC129602611 [Paramacrobiotus metropolitanus]|uniref:uncharacterized protein LOC129602611 n=1 Tax=Paramacrobiotus metropolitanus TaxID=2943436 RepID=UPI002445E40C|nr:uncharacterized protein LOC129602611 [Paramacrobiotus metropolitanus]